MKHGLILVLLSFAGVNLANALDLESNQLRVNGHSLHYYQAGTKGTPLILLTGYATTIMLELIQARALIYTN